MSTTTTQQRTAQIRIATAMGASMTAMYMFNGIQEAAKAEMHLSDFDLSLVEGVAVAIPMALFGIPVGLLADRFSRMRLMLAMTVLWSLSAIGTAWAPTVPILFIMRLLAATGASAMFTTSISLIADCSPPDHRGQALLVNNLGKLVFMAAALPLGAALVVQFSHHPLPGLTNLQSWRAAHVVLAAGGILVAAMLLTLHEPPRLEVSAGVKAPIRVVLRELWMRRTYLGPLMFGQTGMLMADAAATIWATPILTRKYHLAPVQLTLWLGVAVLVAGILGSLIGGYAADAGHRSGRKGWIMLGGVVASALAIPAALFPLAPNASSLFVALTVLLVCGTIGSLALMALITTHLPNETRGLTFGIFLAVGGLVGFGLAPTLVIVVAGWLGGEMRLAQALAFVGGTVSVVGFAGFVQAMRCTPAIA